ncbi:MAG: hypothetical protein WCP21_19120, partial [Armatimonadota bacterium]
FQYLEIKLKCDKDGGGEFFWANTTEGKDQGFMAGQEIPFSLKGDGAFHVYRVFPGWTGRLSRLRFDPPEGTAIEIASLRLMQAPVTRHDPASHRWDFAADGAGGFVPTSGCLYDQVADGLKVTLDSTDAVLTGPAVVWKAVDSRWLTLHLTSTVAQQVAVKWASGPEGRFGGTDLVSLDVTPGEQYLTLNLAEQAGWTGNISRLALRLSGEPGNSLVLHSLAVSPQPEGPPRLKVLSFDAERAIVAAGTSVKLVLRCRNEGGTPARELRATLSTSGSPPSLSLPTPAALPEIAPGAMANLDWTVSAAKPGASDVQVRLAGAGLFGQVQAATSLLVTLPAPELPVARAPLVKVLGSTAVLANENLRLVFLSTDQPGFSLARVDLREGEGYRVMGCLPALARLAVDRDALPVAIPLQVSGSGASAGEAWLRLSGQRAGLGVEVTYRLAARKFWADLSYRLTVQDKKAHALKAFQGPWLWAGEGGFGDAQDRAIFPGVEWLVQGERSSSALDIAPPNQIRFAPHPNWITVPSMAVQQDGACVGLMWDPRQKWDGTRLRPGAVFASPNFVEGRRNHLLGLFLPSIPDFVQPNTLLAKAPYALKPGQTLTLQASLLARPRTEV